MHIVYTAQLAVGTVVFKRYLDLLAHIVCQADRLGLHERGTVCGSLGV